MNSYNKLKLATDEQLIINVSAVIIQHISPIAYFLSSQKRYNGTFCSHAMAVEIFDCSYVGRGSFKSVIVSPLLMNALT